MDIYNDDWDQTLYAASNTITTVYDKVVNTLGKIAMKPCNVTVVDWCEATAILEQLAFYHAKFVLQKKNLCNL